MVLSDANIILEGISGVGKTELAIALEQQGYIRRKVHMPTTFTGTIYNFMPYFQNLAYVNGDPFVYDGGHIGELVYGNLLQEYKYEDGVLRRWFWSMERALSSAIESNVNVRPTVIVYLYSSARSETDVDREMIYYNLYLSSTRLPVIVIDVKGKTTSDVLDELKERLHV